MARQPRHPILTECCTNDRSLGRLGMARQPRHPILRTAPLSDRFFPLSNGRLQGANYLIINN